MELLLTKTAAALVLPPGVHLVLAVLGAAALPRWRRLGRSLIFLSIATLYLFSWPMFAGFLADGLESEVSPLELSELGTQGVDAIVVLGGGVNYAAPEYAGEDTVSSTTLARVRYAAHLHRETGLPLLVSGGKPRNADATEGELMRGVLEEELGVPVAWTETESRTTAENAIFSSRLLAGAQVDHVVLVTHALHMVRSLEAFERAGLRASAAPVEFIGGERPWEPSVLPRMWALEVTYAALHEHLGRVWYRIRY